MGWWSGWCWGRAVVVHISMLTLEEMPLIPLSSRRTPIYRIYSAANRKVSNSVDRYPKNNWKFKVKIKHYLSMKLKIKHFLSNFFCWRLFAVTRATASAPAPSQLQISFLLTHHHSLERWTKQESKCFASVFTDLNLFIQWQQTPHSCFKFSKMVTTEACREIKLSVCNLFISIATSRRIHEHYSLGSQIL